MDCTIKKDKFVMVVPPFSSSVPNPSFFPGTALMEIYVMLYSGICHFRCFVLRCMICLGQLFAVNLNSHSHLSTNIGKMFYFTVLC